MRASHKVLINSITLYSKIIISILVGLYLTRIVLDVLGVEDFGIYNLIAGVIAILVFIESALMASSQRYISIALGEKNIEKCKSFFVSSIIIHIIIGVVIFLILEICGLFLFDGFLNIPQERLEIAKIIYQLMILSTLITICGVPFNAVINSYEDIWYFGLIQIGCNLLRFGVIFAFDIINCDALLLYTLWMMGATAIGVVCSIVWCRKKYGICKNVNFSFSKNRQSIKDMFGFAGWNTLGSFAIVARNQGVSIVLNVFFGPAINAVYGIAYQVNGQLSSFSNTTTIALTPQIVKSQGEGNYDRMRILSVFACKVAFIFSAIFAIPFLIELPIILRIWLKDVPEYAELYCQQTLIMFLITELYPGLSRGIQAVGKIKWREITASIVIVLPLLVGTILFQCGYPHYYILYMINIAQAISMLVTVAFSKYLFHLNVKSYLGFVAKTILLFFFILIIGHYADSMFSMTNDWVRILVVSGIVDTIFCVLYFIICLNTIEKNMLMNMFRSILSKIKLLNR